MIKQIRKAMLKVPQVRKVVTDYRSRQRERKYRTDWADKLKSGGIMRL
ncbi:MAG: hypothetical protein AB7E31_04400 [Desulfitobacterium sp.]